MSNSSERDESAEETLHCAICGEPIEGEHVLTLDGEAHEECDDMRTDEAMEVFDP